MSSNPKKRSLSPSQQQQQQPQAKRQKTSDQDEFEEVLPLLERPEEVSQPQPEIEQQQQQQQEQQQQDGDGDDDDLEVTFEVLARGQPGQQKQKSDCTTQVETPKSVCSVLFRLLSSLVCCSCFLFVSLRQKTPIQIQTQTFPPIPTN
jgi:hypothetical protein